jgi:CRP-like cAMP-binding protein/tRNA A-37 threonylcarbamoyl transferase component Bud32
MGGVCSTVDEVSPKSNERAADNGTSKTEASKSEPSRASRTKAVPEHPGNVTRRRIFAGSRVGGNQGAPIPHKVTKTEADQLLVRGVLQERTLLGALSSYELDEMIGFMDVVSLKAGESCDLSGSLCVVLEGAVVLNATSTQPTERHTSRSVFGQVGLFNDSSKPHVEDGGHSGGEMRAVAESLTRICRLPGSAYRQGMEFSRQAQIKANMKLLSSIPIFSKLSVTERMRISDASSVCTFSINDVIIAEGEPGEHFYIIRSGGASVSRGVDKKGERQLIDYKYPGDYFGEAALLEGAPRNATVVAAVPNTEVLCIDRALFNKQLIGPLSEIMERSETTIQQQMLVSVPLLSQLTADKRDELTGRLQHESFCDGDFVFRQGELGDKLFIIKSGEVSVLCCGQLNGSMSGGDAQREIDHLYTGQYFGERALLKEEPRMASVQACGDLQCYSLSKQDFDKLSLKKDVAWRRRWDMEDTRDVSLLKVDKVMGAGAFGTAWLVVQQQTKRWYALKALDKHTVKRQNWTSVVVREKDILASLSPHPCVVTLHNCFQTPTQLFMLMELATGGELYSLLEKVLRFEPSQARFYTGCVVLAIGHLHKHGVIFRDLKPENLLLAENGYLKLIDMGFAKRLGRGEKTYTLCGTPYYLAPEMILHRGHGFALDWWTVGVLTYEMIEGDLPFTGNSEMEVYGKVTRMQYSCGSRFPDAVADFIHLLLRKEPENRLGNLRNGVDDVMAHPWFYHLNWDRMLEGAIPAPCKPPKPNTSSERKDSAQRQKVLDLSEVMTDSKEFGYWPRW